MTWFLDGQRYRVCHRPRIVRLGTNFLQWSDSIRNEWIDRLQAGIETYFQVVKPNPPASPGEQHIAHVILYQAPQPQDRQGLVSAVYTNGHDVFIHRTAHCLPLHMCQQIFNHRIEAVYRGQHVRNQPYRPTALEDGASIVCMCLSLDQQTLELKTVLLQIHNALFEGPSVAVDLHGEELVMNNPSWRINLRLCGILNRV